MMAQMAVAMPLMLAGEQSMLHFPRAEEVRLQPISRSANETEWPFSVDDGTLACVWSGGRKVVVFIETPKPSAGDDGDSDEFKVREVIVTTDPFMLTLGNMSNRALFRPAASIEERIKLVAPFVTLGEKLCDQPAGARVGHGEL